MSFGSEDALKHRILPGICPVFLVVGVGIRSRVIAERGIGSVGAG